MLTLTRKVGFCASHIYRGGGLSKQQIEEIFGIASGPDGHGHNYVLEVAVKGEVSPIDGMVVNIKDLDRILKSILTGIDHRLLNTAVPEFHDGVPTTERLAQVLWNRLPEKIGGASPVSLRLEEAPGLYVELIGANPNMVYLTRSIEFSASHRLHTDQLSNEENLRIYGKCNNPNGHGHNYVVEVTVCGQPDPKTGIIINLDRFDELLDTEIDSRFDHRHLNLDTEFFKNQPATAENIARVIWGLLADRIPACRDDAAVKLHRVRLIETARSWFDYHGD